MGFLPIKSRIFKKNNKWYWFDETGEKISKKIHPRANLVKILKVEMCISSSCYITKKI